MEKDYVISWFLKENYVNDLLREAIAFKGGTALRKVYFPETWRLSYDLDFTVLGDLSPEEIADGFKQVFGAAKRNSGIVFSLKSFHATGGSVIASLQFKGPLVQENRIRTDITCGEKLIFDPEWRVVKTVYPDLPEFRVKVYSLEEILIEKLRSIIQRGKSRDYYDVWRLLKENKFDMHPIRELLITKCKINDVQYKPQLIFDDTQLTEAKRYWQKALGELARNLPDFEEAISELKKKLIL